MKIEEIKDLLVDGETLLNKWEEFEKMCNVRLFVSSSNFLHAKTLLSKSLDLLEDKEVQFNEYMHDFRNIIKILEDKEINDTFKSFIETNDIYMDTIIVSEEQKLYITIYKNFKLDKEPEINLSNFLEEFIAYALFRKEENKNILMYSIEDAILDFNKEFNLCLDIKDGRQIINNK